VNVNEKVNEKGMSTYIDSERAVNEKGMSTYIDSERAGV
jgi:hypothetical protein